MTLPVAIIGAGPYGLSLASHLLDRGIPFRIFGEPMAFWTQVANAGSDRYLLSSCFGTNIHSPRAGSTFNAYNAPRGLETVEPCAISNFADYGRLFQRQNVPSSEAVNVEVVTRVGDVFRLDLADGTHLLAGRVVVATGLSHYAKTPEILSELPANVAKHTSAITSFAAYKGLNVAVIGAGQSALEAAALLREAGAKPRLLVRESRVRWHTRNVQHGRSPWRRLRSPVSKLGTGPKAWALCHFPAAARCLPLILRKYVFDGYLPPAGAWWLRDRVENVLPIEYCTTVVGARPTAAGVQLQLDNSETGAKSTIVVDHVVAGSGYDVNIKRLPFLGAELRTQIKQLGGSPYLNHSFESSVPGLFFVGATSVMSFGPMFRFVAGCEYASRKISSVLSRAQVPSKMPLNTHDYAST